MWNYIARELTDRERGGFYGAQDADNGPHDDGSYWSWTYQEFRQVLSAEEATVLVRHYGVRPEGNIAGTEGNALRVTELARQIAAALEIPVDVVEQRIASGRRKLAQARLRRKKPGVDQNKYTGWNALLISAVLEAGALLALPEATEAGLQAIETILRDAYDQENGFYHNYHSASGARLPGFFEDQAYMANALLDAFAVSGNRGYLDSAQQTLELCLTQYWDQEYGGFSDLAHGRLAEGITEFFAHPRKLIEDMPMPSPNALAARALDRLWALLHEERYHDYARRTLEAFAGHAPDYGPFAAYYGLAVYYHLHPPVSVVIIGHLECEDTRRLQAAPLPAIAPGARSRSFPPDTLSCHTPRHPTARHRPIFVPGRPVAKSPLMWKN